MDGTYAQNYQDTWLASVAQRNQWTNEFFLDIGAFHGVQCSNTALLEKKYGWRGICVEPTPYADFSQRSCALVQRAVGDVTGRVVRFTGGGQMNQRALAQVDGSKVNGSIFDVATITSSDVLSCVNGTAPGSTDCGGISKHLAIPSFIAFASVDVEGMQMDVLSTFPWDEVKVAVWIIENNQGPAQALMLQRGYLKAPVQNAGVDEYYILPQYWDPALANKEYRVHPAGSYGC